MSWPGQEDWHQHGGYGPPQGQPYPLPGQPSPAPSPPPGPPPQPQPGQGPPAGGPGFVPPPANPQPGGPPPGMPPPPRNSGPAPAFIVGVVALVAVLIAIVVSVGLAVQRASDRTDKALGRLRSIPTPTFPAPVAPGAPSSGSGTGGTSAPPSVPPKISGWHGVPSLNHGLAYDVPPTWKVEGPTTIIGFEGSRGQPTVAMSGAAGVHAGKCSRAAAGVSGGGGVDVRTRPDIPELTATARTVARRWAAAGWTPDRGAAPTVRLGSPQVVNVSGTKAVHVEAAITVNGTRGACDPPRAVVHVVVMDSTRGAPVAFVAYSDQDVSGAASEADLAKTISTLRRI